MKFEGNGFSSGVAFLELFFGWRGRCLTHTWEWLIPGMTVPRRQTYSNSEIGDVLIGWPKVLNCFDMIYDLYKQLSS